MNDVVTGMVSVIHSRAYFLRTRGGWFPRMTRVCSSSDSVGHPGPSNYRSLALRSATSFAEGVKYWA